jgi:RNA-binding protein
MRATRTVTQDQMRKLRGQAKGLSAIMQIGKNGVTPGTLDLVDRELFQKQLIKIKLLKNAVGDDGGRDERRAIVLQLATELSAQIIEQVGSVVVLYRTGPMVRE